MVRRARASGIQLEVIAMNSDALLSSPRSTSAHPLKETQKATRDPGHAQRLWTKVRGRSAKRQGGWGYLAMPMSGVTDCPGLTRHRNALPAQLQSAPGA